MEKSMRKVQARTSPVGARIYELRTRHRWTLKEAAKAWGLTHETLRHYEMGLELPKSDKAIRIARAEGVSLDWIFAMDAEAEA